MSVHNSLAIPHFLADGHHGRAELVPAFGASFSQPAQSTGNPLPQA
jgi:hypothetical protein